MKRLWLAAAALALAACERTGPGVPDDLDGRWRVQAIAGAPLGEAVDIWLEIDAETGAISGFNGCNNFTATMNAFGNSLAVGSIAEEPGECPSPEAATDEARFMGVIGHVQRRIRRGESLELLQAPSGSETLLRLRREEIVGG